MQNAELISLSRQIALQRQLNVVANNLANINTDGFKASDLLFEDYIMPEGSNGTVEGADQDLHFTYNWSTQHNMTSGSIEETGAPFDVALEGEGFFSVQTEAGERYTRSGSFHLDSSGTLVDVNGNAVLTDGGPIQFASSETDVVIGRDGSISSSAGAKGKLKLSEFADPQALAQEGNTYFSGPAGTTATDTSVLQGSIERSNVSGVTEMSNMIQVTRAYQTLANLLEKQDELRSSAIRTLGDTKA